jgi:hypothetical protein
MRASLVTHCEMIVLACFGVVLAHNWVNVRLCMFLVEQRCSCVARVHKKVESRNFVLADVRACVRACVCALFVCAHLTSRAFR